MSAAVETSASAHEPLAAMKMKKCNGWTRTMEERAKVIPSSRRPTTQVRASPMAAKSLGSAKSWHASATAAALLWLSESSGCAYPRNCDEKRA